MSEQESAPGHGVAVPHDAALPRSAVTSSADPIGESRELRQWAALHELWTADACRAADQHSIQTLGLPSDLLMERASLAVAQVVQELVDSDGTRPSAAARVEVLCGPGNNGGDGLAVARILARRGHSVRAWICAETYGSSVSRQLDWAKAAGVRVVHGVPQEAHSSPTQTRVLPNTPRTRPPQEGTVGVWAADDEATAPQVASAAADLRACDVVIDALLGTGARGVVKGGVLDAMTWLATCAAPCVAIDLPSCIDADTGAFRAPPKARFEARETVTFERSKPGLHLTPGRRVAGGVTVATIGLTLPPALAADGALAAMPLRVLQRIGPLDGPLDGLAASRGELERLANAEPSSPRMSVVPRAQAAHKGERGHIGVIGGTGPTPGAAVLCGFAALRAGAGLATVWRPAPQPAQPAEPKLPLRPAASALAPAHDEIAGGELRTPNHDDSPEVMFAYSHDARVSAAQVLVVGPGLLPSDVSVQTRSDVQAERGELDTTDLQSLVRELWHEDPRPMVFDASALAYLDAPARGGHLRIITPHPGEALGLLGRLADASEGWDKETIASNRLGAALRLAELLSAVVVLKGPGTVLVAGARDAYVLDLDDARLATAGAGDVLAGLIAASLMLSHSAVAACRRGLLLHAAAARHAGARLMSPTAGDLARAVGTIEPDGTSSTAPSPRLREF